MLRIALLALVALFLSLLLVFSALDTPAKISPQGCRMSYMSPSYVLQTGFNSSWTYGSLASRYRLMLYREVGWDPDKLLGVPILFIPGNAGSAHQVRSIASSATRQYYSSPSRINSYFSSRGIKQLDVFAVDFNEDLSAFHGPTLLSQHQYTSDAVKYISSLYPSGTKIIVMGHSMGGIVASTLLPAPEIMALITMSTPHSVPPARFDARMDAIYSNVRQVVKSDTTPIVSICGGITDNMIPSEFCQLHPEVSGTSGLRKTIFTSSLEGCWSGVGHREMVWCHQVRWRVARVALELGGAHTAKDQEQVIETWLRDGLQLKLDVLPSTNDEPLNSELWRLEQNTPTSDLIPVSSPLLIREITQGSHNYNFELPDVTDETPVHFLLFLSKGTLLSVSPAHPSSSKAYVYLCRQESANSEDYKTQSCSSLQPSSLRLIPNPDMSTPFPSPGAGVDETDGIVVYEAQISSRVSPKDYLSVLVSSLRTEGWLIAFLGEKTSLISYATKITPFLTAIRISLEQGTVQTDVNFPNVLSSVLLVYRITTKLSGSCEKPLLSPLLLHTSGPTEAHYYRLQNETTILLHGHQSAPFLPQVQKPVKGLNLSIFTSGECRVSDIEVTIDWWNSFGRWGPRYWNAALSWSAGIVSFMFYVSWAAWDEGSPMMSPYKSLRLLFHFLPRAMFGFTLFSFLPLPSDYWLGNKGEPFFVLLAPIFLLLSSGLVALSWLVLLMILTPYGKLITFIFRGEDEDVKETYLSPKGVLITMFVMGSLVFLLIPWQVAFLSCYLIHWHHCAVLIHKKYDTLEQQDLRAQKLFVLLMMTWCLPIVAPVLIVWIHTLMTGGLTTPFDGDHFVLNSISFVVLTYIMVTYRGVVFSRKHRLEIIPVPYLYLISAALVFILGPRATYRMYEALNWPTLALIITRVLPHAFQSTSGTSSPSTSFKTMHREPPTELCD